MSFGDGGSFIESPLQSPPTAPSHHLSMHQKGLQTDKYYIYNMNIYSNFNGLLMDFFCSLRVLIYCIWFILVMRNNIMFCGFFLFFFCWIIIIIIIICCMVFMNTQTNTHIGQNQTSNMCCSFFEKSDVWLWNALLCFLITKFSYPSQSKSRLQFSYIGASVMYQEDDTDIPLVRSIREGYLLWLVCSLYSWISQLRAQASTIKRLFCLTVCRGR